MNRLVDNFGRAHSYLRISVTDRCNLRCVYCMPAEGIKVKSKSEILTFEEIERISRIMVEMGVTKIRLTGGEPLVRAGLPELVSRLRALAGLETIAMTTNGVLLSENCEKLKAAGLDALNISLDSLDPRRFQELTLRDDHARVMQGIEAAVACGFAPLKINMVVIAGKNTDEIPEFIKFVRVRSLNLRLIEYMPFRDNQWQASEVFSYNEMRSLVEEHVELEPMAAKPGDVAKDFKIKGDSASVSFITSMTDSFCSSCNRLRITASGSIKSCLFYEPEVNFRDAMRAGATDSELQEMIIYALSGKPEAHPPAEELARQGTRAMIEIGG